MNIPKELLDKIELLRGTGFCLKVSLNNEAEDFIEVMIQGNGTNMQQKLEREKIEKGNYGVIDSILSGLIRM